MTDFMYELQRQVNELKENPTSIGFMRNHSLFAYDVNENSVIAYPADCAAREKAIKNSLTAAQYDTLQKTTFISSKETVEEYINLLQRLVNKGIFDIPKTTAPTFPRYPYPIPGGYPMPNLCNSTNWDKVYKDINGITTDDNKQSGDKCECDNGKKCCNCHEAKVKESVDRNNTVYEGPYIHIGLEGFDNPDDIVTKIHQRLVGNDKYINCSIILSKVDGDYSVTLCVNELDNKDLCDVFTIINGVIKDEK